MPIVYNSYEFDEGPKAKPGTSQFYYLIGICIFLTFFAGLMSGLTVGYLSIDKLDLEIK